MSARLSRLTASGNMMTGSEQVLINDWCQQFPSHSIGSLNFGPDGALYVTGGDGASFNYVDSGQTGNPCGDPPREGGALRSQDVRTIADPTTLDGAVLRINKSTGQGLPDNPFAGSSDANARRIIAYGLRNPFRFDVPARHRRALGRRRRLEHVGGGQSRPHADRPPDELRLALLRGLRRAQSGYDNANLSLCESLYSAGQAPSPRPATRMTTATPWRAGDGCVTDNGSAVAGLAFASAQSTYPATYDGALFFADHNRNCIWAMLKGADGLPSPSMCSRSCPAGPGPWTS